MRDGRLASIPAKPSKRDVLLPVILDRCFPEDRPYEENEVNMRLAVLHPDVAALRRYLVDGGLMTRQAGVYRRTRPMASVEPERTSGPGWPPVGPNRLAAVVRGRESRDRSRSNLVEPETENTSRGMPGRLQGLARRLESRREAPMELTNASRYVPLRRRFPRPRTDALRPGTNTWWSRFGDRVENGQGPVPTPRDGAVSSSPRARARAAAREPRRSPCARACGRRSRDFDRGSS